MKLTTITHTLTCAAVVTLAGCRTPSAPRADGPLPGVIMKRGVYSTSYAGDWASLPTGKELARRDPAERTFEDVVGEEARTTWKDQDEVRIADRSLRVTWNGPANKMKTTLFTIRECRRVVIENVDIIHQNPDHRGYDTIRIEDCDEVIVRNCHFGGAIQHYHLRFEGCGLILVERVEIAGKDYGEKGFRCGGGIFVQNGATGRGGPRNNMIHTPNPRLLRWLTIQHCYIHDLLASEGKHRNQDGILIHSAPEGIIFNCVVENWDMKHGDGAMDVSFRRTDLANGFFRVERNIFRNCSLCKGPGGGDPSNALMWANNVFVDAFFGDYHDKWPLYHVHNTYIRDHQRPVYKIWGTKQGPAIFENNLVHARCEGAYQIIYQNTKGKPDRYRNTAFDHNVYLMPAPEAWVNGDGAEVKSWSDWRDTEKQDAHSIFAAPAATFVDRSGGDYRLLRNSPAVGAASPKYLSPATPWLRVDRDFLGKPRPAQPSAGAFETIE